jgi:hypothetical protein
VAQTDWLDWHRPYEDPDSPLSHRLRVVQEAIRTTIEGHQAGPIAVVSLCAGQGHDLIGILEGHPRHTDVRARLVEQDPRNVAAAQAAAARAGLEGLDVVVGDASVTDSYEGAVPASLVLVCGVFGNVSDADIAHTVGSLSMLCAPGATVIWTRHRRPPDVTPSIRRWFSESGYDEVSFTGPEGFVFGVGVHRLVADPVPLRRGERLFTFRGDGSRPA